ncbi:MAG: hypothetical protein HC771_22565 [Synechococcales cyanobacterium CRU_2_2]|nr:hypothetical protein [Synechococcales cyanobacterium CRU_2_2]
MPAVFVFLVVCTNRDWMVGVERGFLQSLLRQLAQIKKQHPDQFRFKILGTHENFVVCDRSFAGLGVHPMPIAHHIFLMD